MVCLEGGCLAAADNLCPRTKGKNVKITNEKKERWLEKVAVSPSKRCTMSKTFLSMYACHAWNPWVFCIIVSLEDFGLTPTSCTNKESEPELPCFKNRLLLQFSGGSSNAKDSIPFLHGTTPAIPKQNISHHKYHILGTALIQLQSLIQGDE